MSKMDEDQLMEGGYSIVSTDDGFGDTLDPTTGFLVPLDGHLRTVACSLATCRSAVLCATPHLRMMAH